MWMVRTILFFLALSLAAVSDVRKRIIPDWIPCLVAAVSLIPPGKPSMLGLLACLPLLIAGITTGGIGGGDVKLTAACGVVLGLRAAFIGLLAALLLMLIWHGVCMSMGKIRKKKSETGKEQAYPLVPFLWIGMLLGIGTGGIF